MMTSEYRFTQSRLVLRDLARTHLRPPPPALRTSFESTQDVTPFEYLDGGLCLLGHLYTTQDDHLRKEFKQQQDFINEKFRLESYDAGRRDEKIDENFRKINQRLDRVDQRFEEVGQRFEEVGQRIEEVEQRVNAQFSEMRAMTLNSRVYRANDRIQPVTVFENRRLYTPDEKVFPVNVKAFWKLRENALKRFQLLSFYSIEGYEHWNTETEELDSDSNDTSAESLSLEDAARHYPSKCLEVLATRLGLDYDKIRTEMNRLEEYRQQATSKPVKRPQDDVVSPTEDETSKRPQLQLRRPGSVQVRNSQGSTDVVSETDLQRTEQQSQGSTEVHSLEKTSDTTNSA